VKTIVALSREICTSVVLAAEDHADLEAPVCARHWKTAVGVVTWETSGDHEHREPFCPGCAWDVQCEAMRAATFAPPIVSALTSELAWSVAA
jgi:hypothetical protein